MKPEPSIFYIDVYDIYSYVEDGIREGKIWAHTITTTEGNTECNTFAVKMYQNITYKIKNISYYAKNNEYIIFTKLNKIPNIVSLEQLENNYFLSALNEYCQFINAVSYFQIKDDINRMYLKAEHNRYKHERDIQIVNMLNNKISNPDVSSVEKDLCNQILSGRLSGRILDYNALSELGEQVVPNILQDEKIAYASISLFVEDDMNKEQDFDVDNVIKNEKDNLIITFMDDHERMVEILFEQNIRDIEYKSHNIDAMSIEELLAFKSEIDSISCDISISSVTLNKLSQITNSIENVKEQLKQETIEKDDMYKMPSLNDYEDLIR